MEEVDNAELRDLSEIPRVAKRERKAIKELVLLREVRRRKLNRTPERRKELKKAMQEYNSREATEYRNRIKRQQLEARCISTTTTSTMPSQPSVEDSNMESLQASTPTTFTSVASEPTSHPSAEVQAGMVALSESKSLSPLPT